MPPRKIIFKRLLVSLLIGLALGAAISEIPFLFLRETARLPQEIVLTIPAGTAEQVAGGQQPLTIPENLTFVVGDTFIIKNEDAVDHKLGTLWIPAHSTAQMSLGSEESLLFECSFRPDNYLGIDVHEPLTTNTRIFGILYAGLPMSVLIALYSLIMPVKKDEHASA